MYFPVKKVSFEYLIWYRIWGKKTRQNSNAAIIIFELAKFTRINMTESEILDQVVMYALKRANAEIPNLRLDNVTESTPLYGLSGAVLDSLNLVSFVFLLENIVEEKWQKKITITTADVLNNDHPPFANVLTLSKFLKEKLL